MNRQTLAAIDIGTNTFRLLVAEVAFDPDRNTCTLHELASRRVITRLGEGLQEQGKMTDEAMERGIETLSEFSAVISGYPVVQTSAVATSALREARNSMTFVSRVKDRANIDLEIISGNREAELTTEGILFDSAPHAASLMIDIGGGSTELIYAKARHPELIESLNLGVVYLAGKYMTNDPPKTTDLDKMEREIMERLSGTVRTFKASMEEDTVLIGTAGTISALAAISLKLRTYEHNKIHDSIMTLDTLKQIYSDIAYISSVQRAAYLPFEPSRLDIIVPGTLILLKLMEALGFNKIRVSNYGLREGIMIDLYKKVTSPE